MFYHTSKIDKKPEILHASSYDASIKRHLISDKYCVRVESMDASGRNHFFGVYAALTDALEMQRRIKKSWKNESPHLILHSLFLYCEPTITGRHPEELVRIDMRDIGDPSDLPDMCAIIIKSDGVYLEGHKDTYDFKHRVKAQQDYTSLCQAIIRNPIKAAFDLYDHVAVEMKVRQPAQQLVQQYMAAA